MGKALSGELSCPCDRSCYSPNIKFVRWVYNELAWTKSRKSYCTTPGVDGGTDDVGDSVSVSKMLKFLR